MASNTPTLEGHCLGEKLAELTGGRSDARFRKTGFAVSPIKTNLAGLDSAAILIKRCSSKRIRRADDIQTLYIAVNMIPIRR